MNDIVYVTSMASAIVGFSIPERHFTRSWPKKGARLPVEKDILREAIYQPGVEYLFKQGHLYIEDHAFKVEIGLEEEGTTPATAAVIALDDKLAMRIIKLMPLNEVKTTLDRLTEDQKRELFNFALAHHKDLDKSRVDLIDEACNVDIMRAIKLRKEMEE